MSEHAVLVHLPGSLDPTDLADVADLEDVLIDAIGQIGAGELDGHEVDLQSGDVVIYTYGADANQLAGAIIDVLVGLSYGQGAYLVKRYGPPGAREERVGIRTHPNRDPG